MWVSRIDDPKRIAICCSYCVENIPVKWRSCRLLAYISCVDGVESIRKQPDFWKHLLVREICFVDDEQTFLKFPPGVSENLLSVSIRNFAMLNKAFCSKSFPNVTKLELLNVDRISLHDILIIFPKLKELFVFGLTSIYLNTRLGPLCHNTIENIVIVDYQPALWVVGDNEFKYSLYYFFPNARRVRCDTKQTWGIDWHHTCPPLLEYVTAYRINYKNPHLSYARDIATRCMAAARKKEGKYTLPKEILQQIGRQVYLNALYYDLDEEIQKNHKEPPYQDSNGAYIFVLFAFLSFVAVIFYLPFILEK